MSLGRILVAAAALFSVAQSWADARVAKPLSRAQGGVKAHDISKYTTEVSRTVLCRLGEVVSSSDKYASVFSRNRSLPRPPLQQLLVLHILSYCNSAEVCPRQ